MTEQIPPSSTMWEQLSPPWQAAVDLAWEADCSGSIPIGAVIMTRDADGREHLAAAGRNRIHDPHACGPTFLAGMPLAHAEINALAALDQQAVRPRDCVIYTTTEPCPMCAGALFMGGVRHIRYASRDSWAGSTDLYRGNSFIGSKQVRVEGPQDARFEAVLIALQVEFFMRENVRRGAATLFTRNGPFFRALEAAIPEGVRLGEQLFQSGRLQQMREAGASAAVVVEELARALEPLQPRWKRDLRLRMWLFKKYFSDQYHRAWRLLKGIKI